MAIFSGPDEVDFDAHESGPPAGPTTYSSLPTPISEVVVNATNFVHTAGITALGLSSFNPSLASENEVGEVVARSVRGDGSLVLTLKGEYLGPYTFGDNRPLGFDLQERR